MLPKLQQVVNLLRMQFDSRPKDTPNAPTHDSRIDRWYTSVGLFEGMKGGRPLSVHLLKSFDGSHYAFLINGKDFKSVYSVRDVKLASCSKRVAYEYLLKRSWKST